jgi:hypothetical protein
VNRIAIPIFALFFAGCCFLAPIGCATSAIVDHARAAQIVGPVITAAGEVIRDTRAAELDRCTDEACLDRLEHLWAPAVASYNLTREGYVAWVEGMSLAALAELPDAEVTTLLLPLAFALVRLYSGVETALEPFEEIDLPDFPGLGLLTGGD